jgi:hypothetical protein
VQSVCLHRCDLTGFHGVAPATTDDGFFRDGAFLRAARARSLLGIHGKMHGLPKMAARNSYAEQRWNVGDPICT